MRAVSRALCMMRELCDWGTVTFTEPIFTMLQIRANWVISGATALLWRTCCVSEQYTAAPRGWRSRSMVQLRLLRQIMLLSSSLPLLLCSSVSCSTPCLVLVCWVFLVGFFFFFFFTLSYTILLFCFWICFFQHTHLPHFLFVFV